MGTQRGDDWVSKSDRTRDRGGGVGRSRSHRRHPRPVPFLGNASAGIHDAAALPEQINICGCVGEEGSLAEIRARDGIEPVVVDPELFASCPAGPCTTVAQNGPCDTVIYVPR